MAITRQQKEEFVAAYTDKLSRSEAAYLADYRGLSVAEISDLRAQLREESETELVVAKNRLLKIAFKEAGWVIPEEHLQGPTAILFCFDDPITPAKALLRYAKKNETVSVKGGAMRKNVMDAEGVKGMADLPGRQEILATLVGTISSASKNLARNASRSSTRVVWYDYGSDARIIKCITRSF